MACGLVYPRKAFSPSSTPKLSLENRLTSCSNSSSNDWPDPPLAHCLTYKVKQGRPQYEPEKVRTPDNITTNLAQPEGDVDREHDQNIRRMMPISE